MGHVILRALPILLKVMLVGFTHVTTLEYPEVLRDETVVDDYYGTKVALRLTNFWNCGRFTILEAQNVNNTNFYSFCFISFKQVADPYRWLEDLESNETKEFVIKQTKLTDDFLENIQPRQEFKEMLTNIVNYPKFSAPTKKKERYFYFHNSGLQNHE